MTNAARDTFIVGLRNACDGSSSARADGAPVGAPRRIPGGQEQADSSSARDQRTAQAARTLPRSLWREHFGSQGHHPVRDGQHAGDGACRRGDEILKNTFANNAFENFEIAAYKSLLALCDSAGASDAKADLETSLKEEQRMAAWIDSNVENVTMEFLEHRRRAA